jgi:hypothetical protein
MAGLQHGEETALLIARQQAKRQQAPAKDFNPDAI